MRRREERSGRSNETYLEAVPCERWPPAVATRDKADMPTPQAVLHLATESDIQTETEACVVPNLVETEGFAPRPKFWPAIVRLTAPVETALPLEVSRGPAVGPAESKVIVRE